MGSIRNWDCELTSNGIIESLLGQVAGLVGSVQDLVVENGEVEGQTQADGVSGRQLSLGDLGGGLIRVERLVGRLLAAVTDSELREVSVVIALPGRTLAKCALPYLVLNPHRHTSCGRRPWTRQTWQRG